MSIEESLKSTFKQIDGKIKNPFIFTYILITLLRSWDLIYKVIYFPDTLSVQNRISQIKCFYAQNSVFYEWWGFEHFLLSVVQSIFISFVVLIGTYLLIYAAHFITELYQLKSQKLDDSLSEKLDTPKYTDLKNLIEEKESLAKELSSTETQLRTTRERLASESTVVQQHIQKIEALEKSLREKNTINRDLSLSDFDETESDEVESEEVEVDIENEDDLKPLKEQYPYLYELSQPELERAISLLYLLYVAPTKLDEVRKPENVMIAGILKENELIEVNDSINKVFLTDKGRELRKKLGQLPPLKPHGRA